MLNLVDQAHERLKPYWGSSGPAVPLLSPRYLPSFLTFLSPWLCPPFGPSPSQLSLPPYHCLLVLWTSSLLHPNVSGSPYVAAAAPAHAAGPAGAAEQLHWCWQCRSVSLPGSSRMNAQTSYTTYRAMLWKEMTTGCYCITLLNNECVFLENTCHLIPLALQTCTTGW